MKRDTIWTSDPMTIGKHEWRIHQFHDSWFDNVFVTYEWRRIASMYAPGGGWRDQKLWPSYDHNNGMTAGLPKTLARLHEKHRDTIAANKRAAA